jgi:hypothetical protein
MAASRAQLHLLRFQNTDTATSGRRGSKAGKLSLMGMPIGRSPPRLLGQFQEESMICRSALRLNRCTSHGSRTMDEINLSYDEPVFHFEKDDLSIDATVFYDRDSVTYEETTVQIGDLTLTYDAPYTGALMN